MYQGGSIQPQGADSLADLDLRGLARGQTQILGALRLQVMPGETLAILGPSGIGKTSLLRVLAGLETRFSGNRRVTQALAFVFQEPTLLPWRSARQNITLLTGCSDEEAVARLTEVGLGAQGDLFPGQMSLGQQRRLSLARAFAVNPSLLLMDEPFVSLDPGLADDMQSLFERLRAQHGTTTVFVTHSMEEAERLASRIVTLGGQPATVQSNRLNPV